MSQETLSYGARGAAVRRLQQLLNDQGATPPLEVDGHFGRRTEAAVRTFQTDQELEVDGWAGPTTWSRLEALDIATISRPIDPGFGWSLPIGELDGPAVVTSPYGYRIHPITEERKHHDGIDFRTPTGTPLVAMAAGEVTRIDVDGHGRGVFNGHAVWLELLAPGGERVRAAYLHCSDVLVDIGDRVLPGQLVALAGSTGRSTGPHLHLQCWRYIAGRPKLIDPAELWPAGWTVPK